MSAVRKQPDDYVIRLLATPGEAPREDWNELLAAQDQPTPFMRHEYLAALHDSASATAATGWEPAFVTLWRAGTLQAACAFHLKAHSYGEYVFDWAWADAYHRHGIAYYPKLLSAVPFTPVSGCRLLAATQEARDTLLQGALQLARDLKVSSLHCLFPTRDEAAVMVAHGMMPRTTVQFHWENRGYADFGQFLAGFSHDKRKKVRQERRKVLDAGIRFKWLEGDDIRERDWAFFERCYRQTYRDHHSSPYLTLEFFCRIGRALPRHMVLIL
ncbi:peptidogalycan biosysnthesis protein, partial [Ramlibacter sp.]|uniref:peptidogalycan biosysnthesis protein n=1 Tax=Ramlibacter sp. TaxID=1917967 RepID=UPI002D2225AB